MANLANPVTPTTVLLGQTGHATLHTEERDYIESLRQKIAETIEAVDVSGAKTIAWSAGAFKDYRLVGNTTFTFDGTGLPASGNNGQAMSITMRLRQDGTGNRTVTWPTPGGVLKWAGGSWPTLTVAALREDWLTFVTLDGGATWRGFMAGKDVR